MEKQAENEEIECLEVQTLPPLIVAKDIKNIRDAKKLLSKLISEFCRGRIESKQAKDLTYMLSVYVGMHKEANEEQRTEDFKRKYGYE